VTSTPSLLRLAYHAARRRPPPSRADPRRDRAGFLRAAWHDVILTRAIALINYVRRQWADGAFLQVNAQGMEVGRQG